MFKKKDSIISVADQETTRKQQHISDMGSQLEQYAGDVGSVNRGGKKAYRKQEQDNIKTKAKRKAKKIENIKVPKTVQESIPYQKVYRNGIIQSDVDTFTKTYELTDANFKTTNQDNQDEMYLAYQDLLNYFTPDIKAEITIFNNKIDEDSFKNDILLQMQDDDHNDLRAAMNDVLTDRMSEGQSNIIQKKYITVSVKAEDVEIAMNIFSRVDGEVAEKIKAINDARNIAPMNLQDRLNLLYDIYNQDAPLPFFKKANIDGKESRTFDIKYMQSLGLTTKDIVGPDTMIFPKWADYFIVGEKYARAMYLKGIPSQLSADILTDIANVPCTAIVSVHFSPMKQDEAIKLVRNQLIEIDKDMGNAVKKNAKSGLGAEFVSPTLRQEKAEAEKAFDDITAREQKSMLMTLVAVVFADTMEELDKYSKMVQNNASKHLCIMNKLVAQQEHGFNTSLPLGVNYVAADRLVNTESAALFIPFESMELSQKDGQFYGVNATSHNLIVIDRLGGGQNSNGLILGMPGSGKSFSAKQEMTQAYLASVKNEIFVIDPMGEYRPLCEKLDGQVVEISPTSKTYINPFDMDVSYDKKGDEDPVKVKSDYICSICESAIGGHYGLNPLQTNIIDRCVIKLYEPYIQHMDKLHEEGSTVTCDRSAAPTLVDFYRLLERQPEPEAKYLKVAMEKYCVGSYNTFANRTNVDTNNRFITYDISKIGTGMNEMGMQICLNDIWNRTVQNKKRGVRTWVYVDELYVLTQSELCSRFLMYMFKQIRKLGGVPTGITQNVEDLMVNRESRALINNSGFVLLLNQSRDDRKAIGDMLHISENQLAFINNADSGHGLIINGKAIVPFVNTFPKENEIYKLISTNPNEQTALS